MTDHLGYFTFFVVVVVGKVKRHTAINMNFMLLLFYYCVRMYD